MGTGANFGLTFRADTSISATLIDAAGATVGTNLAKTPESRGWFRSIFYEDPTTAATWRLRLENTDAFEHEAVITTWKDAVKVSHTVRGPARIDIPAGRE